MKKIIALLLGLVMIFSFSGCFSLPEDYEDNNDVVNDSDEEETKKKEDDKGDAEDARLVADKIDNFDFEITEWNGTSAVCKKGSEYALVSAEGEVSENTFTLVDYISDGYYAVSTEKTELTTEPESRNVFGVAGVDGEIIVPEKYAHIKCLNDRFFLVTSVTEITEDKDDAILYLTDDMFSLEASEDDILYAGKWEVYDVEEEDVIPDLSGDEPTSVTAYENIISVDYDGYYKADGTELPDSAEVFKNGCYSIEEDDNVTVYNEDYKKLFSGKDDFYIYESAESSPDYFIAEDYDSDEQYLMDKKGNKVSEIIEGTISDVLFDEYIVSYQDSKYGLYDFDGEEIFACDYRYIEVDTQFGIEILALRTDTTVTYAYCDGTEIAKAEVESGSYFDCMIAETEDGDETVYFNLETGEFDVRNARHIYNNNWCLESETETDDSTKYGVVDIITGESLVENKYSDIVAFEGYIVGNCGDGTYDFYEIKVEY